MTGILLDIKHFAIHHRPVIRPTDFFNGCPLQYSWHILKTVHQSGRKLTQHEMVGFKTTSKQLMTALLIVPNTTTSKIELSFKNILSLK